MCVKPRMIERSHGGWKGDSRAHQSCGFLYVFILYVDFGNSLPSTKMSSGHVNMNMLIIKL